MASFIDRVLKYLDKMPDDVEVSLLYDSLESGKTLVHQTVGNEPDAIEVDDTYFAELDNCNFAIDIHTHPDYNAVPSAMDIAFYLSNPAIREAIIIGKNEYSVMTFDEDREYVSPRTIEAEYNYIIQNLESHYRELKDAESTNIAEQLFTEASFQLIDMFDFIKFKMYPLPASRP